MTQEPDPKSYSLENLEMWVNDAIESDCNSDEIYNTILETVLKERPSGIKGDFILSVFLTSTMGISYKLKLDK